MNLSEIRMLPNNEFSGKSPIVYYLDYPNLLTELTKEKRDVVVKMNDTIRLLRIRVNRRKKINNIFG